MDTREEARLLEAARAGDERAFEWLIAPRRASLQAHCYRLLGSVAETFIGSSRTLKFAWEVWTTLLPPRRAPWSARASSSPSSLRSNFSLRRTL